MTETAKCITKSDTGYDLVAGVLQDGIRKVLGSHDRRSVLIALFSELVFELKEAPDEIRCVAVPKIIAALKELEE